MSVIDAAASAFGRSQRRSERSAESGVYEPATRLISAGAFLELASDRISRCRGACAVVVISAHDGAGGSIEEHALGAIASAIHESIRPPDLAGRDEQGDIVLVLDRCDREDARQVCSRILRAIYTSTSEGHALALGIAVAPSDGSDLAALLRGARKELRAPRRAALAASPAIA